MHQVQHFQYHDYGYLASQKEKKERREGRKEGEKERRKGGSLGRFRGQVGIRGKKWSFTSLRKVKKEKSCQSLLYFKRKQNLPWL